MKPVKEWTTCRSCGSTDLTPLFSLGEQYVNNFVPREEILSGIKAPIMLDLCNHCTLVQMRHTAPQDLLYSRQYWYRSGVTATMRAALRDITKSIEDRGYLRTRDAVLDIGSNDGTLLRSYRAPVFRVGVEPASNLAQEGAEDLDVFISDFWGFDSYWDRVGRKAQVITAIGMFYDLDDPNRFICDVAKALDRDGVFVAQLMCLHNMLSLHDVGNLAHEHLEFYSLRSLQVLLGEHGLEIFDIEENTVNGSSYRLWIRHTKSKGVLQTREARRRVEEAWSHEVSYTDPATFQQWFAEVEWQKHLCVDFIRRAVEEQGQSVWVYGASTKGNVILQYYGLDHELIDGAAERSPEKWGLHTIGTGIPIYSEEYARQQYPDYFLALPYAFLNEFMERETPWRMGGGKFLVPLPEFRVIQ